MEISVEIKHEIAKAKSLIDLCDQQGLTSPIDENVMAGDGLEPVDHLRALKQANRALHEVLYAPPRQK